VTEQLPAIIDQTKIIGDARVHVVPTLVAASGERASLRFLEFFAANIRNPHMRRANGHAVVAFMARCDENRLLLIAAVQPLHVAAWIELQTREHAAPTVKLHLAALRHLFDWLVMGQVIPVNPAGSVRGPSHVVKEGKTPVLAPEEARALIDRIEIMTPVGLRDRPLIGLMVFSFARDRCRARHEDRGRVRAEPAAMGAGRWRLARPSRSMRPGSRQSRAKHRLIRLGRNR